MPELTCPVCGGALHREERSLRCGAGHCYDLARQGYVNLLRTNRSKDKRHGDDKRMVAARTAFLDAGYYAPLRDAIAAAATEYTSGDAGVLDAGCGEGYYLSKLPQIPQRWGIDVSKEAVRHAAAREKNAQFLVATASHLPFAEASFDALLSMFALTMPEEFSRVLKADGIFIQVLAGEHHLPHLKSLIYPEQKEKEKLLHPQLPGFKLLHSRTLEFHFALTEPQQVKNLLYMTPHVWRITKQGAERLMQVQRLDDAQVVFNVYAGHSGANLLK